jgi:signal transduction histidine kinase
VRTWLFRGGSGGLLLEPDWLVEQNLAFAEPGITVAWLGDVNRDGFADVGVAAWLHKSAPNREGQVALYAGSARGLSGSMLGADTPQPAWGWHPRPPTLPWWRQSWLLTLVGTLVFAGVVAGGFRARELRGLRRRLQALEGEQALHRERARIAQDMHDHLGASLTRLTWLGELARHQLSATQPARAQVEELAAGVRELAGTVDEIVWALNPQKDKLESLASHLASSTEDFLRPTGLRCRLNFPEILPALRLSAEARHSLVLAVKEALHNVFKHARATEVRLHLAVEDHTLQCIVEDDGCGFQTAEAKPERSGLSNMRRRLEALGGRLTVISGPGAGTRICLEVRLPQ